MNPKNQADSVISPIQFRVRQGIHLCQPPPENPLDRRDIDYDMKIVPSDKRGGEERTSHYRVIIAGLRAGSPAGRICSFQFLFDPSLRYTSH